MKEEDERKGGNDFLLRGKGAFKTIEK